MALWGSDIVALAEEAAEYERLVASAASVQRQFIEMENDLERYTPSRAMPAGPSTFARHLTARSFAPAAKLHRRIEDIGNASLSLQYEAQLIADTYLASASALALYEVRTQRDGHAASVREVG